MKITRSVSLKFLIATLLVSFFTAFLISGIVVYNKRTNVIRDIEKTLDDIVATQSKSLAAGMWDLNFSQIKLQLGGIIKLPYIQYVSVVYREYLLEAGDPDQPNALIRRVNLKYGDTSVSEQVGVLTIKANLSLVGQKLWEEFFDGLFWKMVETLLFSLTLYLLFSLLIVKPLDQIARYIETFSLKKLDSSLILQSRNTKNPDEFDLISRRLNDLRENLNTSLQAQHHAESLLKEKILEVENKNAELERFTYTVSHDLKSPLITIKGFSGYIRKDLEGGSASRALQDVDRIITAVDKMHGLLEGLLELSRVGRVVNATKRFFMSQPLNEAIELLEGSLQSGKVSLLIKQTQWPEVLGDPLRIREIWQNLVENAIKYRGKQENLVIEVGFYTKNEEVIYYVKDNGAGIGAAYLDSIFGLFEKLDSTSEGSGLGLSLIKRIVELHEGKIWAESEGAETGSIFCFTIPFKGMGNL